MMRDFAMWCCGALSILFIVLLITGEPLVGAACLVAAVSNFYVGRTYRRAREGK